MSVPFHLWCQRLLKGICQRHGQVCDCLMCSLQAFDEILWGRRPRKYPSSVLLKFLFHHSAMLVAKMIMSRAILWFVVTLKSTYMFWLSQYWAQGNKPWHIRLGSVEQYLAPSLLVGFVVWVLQTRKQRWLSCWSWFFQHWNWVSHPLCFTFFHSLSQMFPFYSNYFQMLSSFCGCTLKVFGVSLPLSHLLTHALSSLKSSWEQPYAKN